MTDLTSQLAVRSLAGGADIVDVAVQMVDEGHAPHLVYDAVYKLGTITTANRFEDSLCYKLAMGCE